MDTYHRGNLPRRQLKLDRGVGDREAAPLSVSVFVSRS